MSYDFKFSAEGTIVGLLTRMPKMKTKLLITAIASVATLSATSASAQLESLREVVYYNFNSAQSAEVEAQMQKITDLASSRNARSIRVTCHTDTTGSAAYNQALSERRAADVLNALVSRGISRNVISSQGLGETSLLVPTGDGVKEQLNRRCEIDLDVEPLVVQQEYVQQEYVQTQPQTQTITETVRAPDPTPIESTTVTRTIPATPQAITSTVPSTTVAVPSTTVAVPSAGVSLPPVAGGGAGISPLVLGAGAIAAGVGAFLIFDGDGDDDEAEAAAAAAAAEAEAAAAAAAPAEAEAAAAALAAAQADAATAAEAQAAAEAAQAEAEAAQAEAEEALADALADNPVSP